MYYYKRIKELREDHDYTQQYVAKKLGIRQEQYSKYERGERELPLHHLIAISKLYNVSTDYILELSDNDRNQLMNCINDKYISYEDFCKNYPERADAIFKAFYEFQQKLSDIEKNPTRYYRK